MQCVLAADDVRQIISDLADQILVAPDIAATAPGRLALVGIRRRGEVLAQRVGTILRERTHTDVNVGAIDITMYRDDVMGARPMTIPMGTLMNFRIDDRPVVLFDDVLHTGRSVRAALDSLVDFGRPRFIRLAVLIDRDGREYPIRADFVGRQMTVAPDSRICVHLAPTDPHDAVYLDPHPDTGPRGVCR